MTVGVAVGVGMQSGGFVDVGPAAGPTIDTAGSLDVSTFKIGTEHTITAGTASATGGGSVTYEYRWLVAGVSDASTAAYTPLAANDEDTISAQWRAVETGGTNPGETAWQAVGSGTITYDAAVNSVVPTISGSTSLGDTLTGTTGTWSGDVGGSYSYQWNRNGIPISGETGTTYTIALADDAADITWTETYTNSGGATSATSDPTTVDDFAAPSATLNSDLTSRTVTAWLTSITGTPTPSPTLDTFTAAGSDVSGSVTGSGTLGDPWTYVVPSSTTDTAIVIGASLDNSVPPAWSDTDSSITVPLDLVLPAYTVSLPPVSDGESIGKPGSGADVEAVLGGTAGTPDDPLTWEFSVNEGAFQSLDPLHTATENEEIEIRISDLDHPAGVFSYTSTPTLVSAGDVTPPVINTFTVVEDPEGTVTVTIDVETGEGPNGYDPVIVGVPAGEAEPTLAQKLAGKADDGTDAEWFWDGAAFGESGYSASPGWDRQPSGGSNWDFYLVIADPSGNTDTDFDLNVVVIVSAGNFNFDGGSASATTNENFDGGSASTTTNEVLDFAA